MSKNYRIPVVLLAATMLAGPLAITAANAAAPNSRTAVAASASSARAAPASLSKAEGSRLLNSLKPADDIAPRMAKIKAAIGTLIGQGIGDISQRDALNSALKETKALKKTLVKLKSGFASAEKRAMSTGGVAETQALSDSLDALGAQLSDAIKDLEAEDSLGNFEIQRLMSQYNQSEQLASSVQKKRDDTSNSVIQKIG